MGLSSLWFGQMAGQVQSIPDTCITKDIHNKLILIFLYDPKGKHVNLPWPCGGSSVANPIQNSLDVRFSGEHLKLWVLFLGLSYSIPKGRKWCFISLSGGNMTQLNFFQVVIAFISYPCYCVGNLSSHPICLLDLATSISSQYFSE